MNGHQATANAKMGYDLGVFNSVPGEQSAEDRAWHQEAKRQYYAGEMMPLLEEYKQKIDALKGQGLTTEELLQEVERITQEHNQKLMEYNQHADDALAQRTTARREMREKPNS